MDSVTEHKSKGSFVIAAHHQTTKAVKAFYVECDTLSHRWKWHIYLWKSDECKTCLHRDFIEFPSFKRANVWMNEHRQTSERSEKRQRVNLTKTCKQLSFCYIKFIKFSIYVGQRHWKETRLWIRTRIQSHKVKQLSATLTHTIRNRIQWTTQWNGDNVSAL